MVFCGVVCTNFQFQNSAKRKITVLRNLNVPIFFQRFSDLCMGKLAMTESGEGDTLTVKLCRR